MGGMLGMASGVFIVPLLALTLPIDLQTAIGAKLLGSLPANLLRWIFVSVLLALVVQMTLTGFGVDLVGGSS